MNSLDHYWYSRNGVSLALLPLSWLFRLVVATRRYLFQSGIRRVTRLPVPVIVVGNVTVGGTGKSPLVIWLAAHLKQLGFNPGIVARGYGGQSETWPRQVDKTSDPSLVGDEPVMLARRTGCPVWVAPDRPAAAECMLENSECDVIIADDGLQHYALGRDLEIAVIDGGRGVGNGFCLPAGPLREPVSRLNSVHLTIANGESGLSPYLMRLRPGQMVNLSDDSKRAELEEFAGRQVHAIAGIGHPARFFNTLRDAGLSPIERPFPDHHPFTADDIQPADQLPVIMTEKDAVKCHSFGLQRHWYLEVDAVPDQMFIQQLDRQLREMNYGQETA